MKTKVVECPICESPMSRERREIKKGIYAEVEVCPKCNDEWIDERGYDEIYQQLFTRRAFKIGGSLAIRIPREIIKALNLHENSELKVNLRDNKIVIEPLKT